MIGTAIWAVLLAFALGWGLGDRWLAWIVFSVVWIVVVGWPTSTFASLGLYGDEAKTIAVGYVAGLFVGFVVAEGGVRARNAFDGRRRRAASIRPWRRLY